LGEPFWISAPCSKCSQTVNFFTFVQEKYPKLSLVLDELSTWHHQRFQYLTLSLFQIVYLLLGDNSRYSKGSPSWEFLSSIDRGKEFWMMLVVNRSDSSDIGQSLDIVAGMMISDIFVEIIIFKV
jgi:hypothetical protein